MKIKFFKILAIVLALSGSVFVFLVLERLTHLATDGFAVVRMLNPLKEETKTPYAEDPSLLPILAQPFYYYNSGGQSYIFISQDQNYILKFFKFHHMRIPPFFTSIALPKPLDLYREKKIKKKNFVLDRTFKSYEIAYDQLKEETALIYLHLKKTRHLKTKIHLVDNIGVHFDLDADEIAFALQKKGTLAYQKIQTAMKDNQVLKAKHALLDLLDLVIARCQKGIGDTDPDFKTNFGFIDERAVQLDIGRFHLDEQEKLPEIYLPEIYRITRPFHVWLEKNYPELAHFFDEKIQELTYEHRQ